MLSRSSSNLSASMSCLGRRSHGWAQTAALRALVRATAEFRAPRTATMVISGQGVDRCTPHGAGRRSPPRRLVYGGTEGAAGLMEWLLTSKREQERESQGAKKKGFSPPPHHARPRVPIVGPPAKPPPRGARAVRRAAAAALWRAVWMPLPDPHQWASNSTMAADMALPRAPFRPRVPEPPAWRQNHRAAAGWRQCSALKIVQTCPHGFNGVPTAMAVGFFMQTG